jgi:hypothetical protein
MHGVKLLCIGQFPFHPLLRNDAQPRALDLGVDGTRQVAPGGIRLDD